VRICFVRRRKFPRKKFLKHPAAHLLTRSEIERVGAMTSFTGDSMSDLQKTVAIVDDDPEMRSSLANLLSAVGYRAETYDSAETFLICASTCKACCLVIDINLGDITGVELAHQLCADGLKWPIIFMSGLDDAAIKTQASAVGPIAFLHKPFRADDLFDAIKKAIR
jgi:FixJ family two-component response regulator